MKINTLYLSTLFCLSLLTACGGGGGSGDKDSADTLTDNSNVVEQTEPETTVNDNEITTEAERTAELRVPSEFDLQQDYELIVDTIASSTNKGKYLTLCSEFSKTETGYEINHRSCILKTYLTETASYTLRIANTTTQLLATVWDLSAQDVPQYSLWERSNNDAYLSIQ
ncbi:Uncharacterised protein [Zhongshania aliphaticivorans]|uniref:Lipoprotein n=1 Tax=Zhongshania aliphaticivorans TaxID=1470434 RepID=A0A5S9Q9E8_9GAMM|nr:hypothetical protein [Zhongshania aliphaticivorans]CAA0086993.1 Uncharacterised protein [Zhongshania aliphaticivorans]CAA0113869.1 Uncharacterised protein [Zhongshania aliphaticivorans]